MKTKKPDPFNEIYELQQCGQNEIAFSTLLDKKTGRIKRPFDSDLNHAWYIVGDILYKAHRYTESIKAFKKSYKHWTDDIQALWGIANCYSELNKPYLSKYYLQKAINIDGFRTDELIYNLGNALFDMRQYDEAISNYKKIGKKDKNLYQMAMSNIQTIEKISKNIRKRKH